MGAKLDDTGDEVLQVSWITFKCVLPCSENKRRGRQGERSIRNEYRKGW
jgi:hypothetical protein